MSDFNPSGIARSFGLEITERIGTFVEVETAKRATTAGRRSKVVKNVFTQKRYRYRNTGELGRNIKLTKTKEGYTVDAGTRANYSSGYHGFYFLATKQGQKDVKNILTQTERYTKTLKL